MLDAAHAGIACLDGADFERQMAGKWNVLLFAFISKSEKSIARRHGNNFDEIGATFLEVVDSGAGCGGIGDGILLGSLPPARSKERAGGNDMRPQESAGFDVALPGEESVEIATHVAHAGNAVREQQREKDLFAPGRIGVDAREMDMHIPETGKQEFSGAVDGACGLGDLDGC